MTSTMAEKHFSRRDFLKGGGALVVAFSLPAYLRPTSGGAVATRAAEWPKVVSPGELDSWLAVLADGTVNVFSGKVELGTGVTTSLAQIVAEELDVGFERVTMVMGDTLSSVDEGVTAGSKTLQLAGPHLRQAGAEARKALVGLAATRLGVPASDLTVEDGVVRSKSDSAKRVSYGELVGGRRFDVKLTAVGAGFGLQVRGSAKPKSPSEYQLVGRSISRVDVPDKLTGRHTYVQDVRVSGMVHGRVVRPPSAQARLVSVNGFARRIPGLIRVVVKGNFVGVVCEREEQAIRAARELRLTWDDPKELPTSSRQFASIRESPVALERVNRKNGDVAGALRSAAKTVSATYRWPFQMHASIGPSCAVADVTADSATVWSPTQGSHSLRPALSDLLGLPLERVRVISVEGSGCYGHNGADDVSGDASLLSQAVGRPVRVQWMRHDEHGWEPMGPAQVSELEGGLDASGKVIAWRHDTRTPTHSTRPSNQVGNLWAGILTNAPAARNAFIGGDRNLPHEYVFSNDLVRSLWHAKPALRSSALRTLGAMANVFANESFMDELAAAAGADPVAFRLSHLQNERMRAVLQAAAKSYGWTSRPAASAIGEGRVRKGRGVAISQYENANAWVAVIADVDVDVKSGAVRTRRVVVGHDCGLIVNPDGLRNQIEGNVIQGISRGLKEEVAFDRSGVTSLEWDSYPILRFTEVPQEIKIALINRPNQPALGAGEPTTAAIPAALANAVYDATGARLRTAPLTPKRVKAALAQL